MKLENLVIHRESLRQMSKEQIEELNTQHGWFSNNIDRFADLDGCLYDAVFLGLYSLRSWGSGVDWEYFLPVKRLQEFIEVIQSKYGINL